MGYYQPIKNNKYHLPHNVYMQIIYIIKDYERMVADYNSKIEESPAPADGMPRGTMTSDPTASKAEKIEELHRKIMAYRKALETIPEEYREPILNNIKYQIRYPDYANLKTWRKWRGRFLQRIAINLNMV